MPPFYTIFSRSNTSPLSLSPLTAHTRECSTTDEHHDPKCKDNIHSVLPQDKDSISTPTFPLVVGTRRLPDLRQPLRVVS